MYQCRCYVSTRTPLSTIPAYIYPCLQADHPRLKEKDSCQKCCHFIWILVYDVKYGYCLTIERMMLIYTFDSCELNFFLYTARLLF